MSPRIHTPTAADDLVIIGLDTEYVERGGVNHIISYQWHGLHGGREWSGIQLVDGERQKFSHLLQHILGDAMARGIIQRYPKAVVVAAHFSLAEIAAMADFPRLKTQLDGIRRTFASVKKPLTVSIRDSNGNTRSVAVTLRDTMLLTPQGSGLHALGEMHGLPKMVLPEGAIEHMDELLRNNPDLFERYAKRDAEIAARHAHAMANLNLELNRKCAVPVSLGGLGVAFTLSTWRATGIDCLDVLGQEVHRGVVFDERTRRTRTTETIVPKAVFHEHEPLAVESYHGGRNEAFYFGATSVGDWLDVDLCGAYTTALAALGMPLWDSLRVSTKLEDFTTDRLGFARVRFRFPRDVRFPCLAVRVLNNLIFPRSGETHATADEIRLALQLGAKIEILHGVVIPMDASVKPFQKVIAEATARRKAAKAKGDALGDKLYKEIGNSLYGKTAQGLREKRAFDTRLGLTAPLPPSQITNAFIAAAVTGNVRAALAEMMNALPPPRLITSVTTDGFITDATAAELEGMQQGPLCRAFGQSRMELTGDGTIIEVKHRARQVLCWRTRGQATIEAAPDADGMLAKAGFKPPRGMSKSDQNALMIDLFCDRDITTTYTFENLRSLSQIYKHGGDLVSEDFLRRLRMDFDWKRRAVAPRTAAINGFDHLAFSTVPWDTADDFVRCREQWQQFQRDTGRCLKSVTDLEAFQEFQAGAALSRAGLYRSSKVGIAVTAVRQFLRAFVRGEWGVDPTVMTYVELVEFLRHGGFEVKLNDVKNASRPNAKLVPGVVPLTGAVMAFVRYVKTRFPNFDECMMLAADAENGVTTYAKHQCCVAGDGGPGYVNALAFRLLERWCKSSTMGSPTLANYTDMPATLKREAPQVLETRKAA